MAKTAPLQCLKTVISGSTSGIICVCLARTYIAAHQFNGSCNLVNRCHYIKLFYPILRGFVHDKPPDFRLNPPSKSAPEITHESPHPFKQIGVILNLGIIAGGGRYIKKLGTGVKKEKIPVF